MEENKIKIFDEPAMIEGEKETTDKRDNSRGLSAYIMITVSIFILITACLFSEIGYNLIVNNKMIESMEVTDEENGFWKISSKDIMKKFLSVGKIYELAKFKEPIQSDEPLKESDQINVIAPVETETETQEEIQEKNPTETENEIKYPVIALDLSQKQLGKNYIVNETGYTPEIEKLKNANDYFEALGVDDKSMPTVLIIHTHGTEAYLENGKEYYTEGEGEISRTTDKNKNVVRIGEIITQRLNSAGVKTLHCEIMHDKESYQDSYARAAESIKSYLAKYPSIKYVFDIHRDAILKSDGSLVKTVTEIEGESVAQVMTVVGSDYKGANFPNWERNLAVALRLKKILDGENESFSRPIYLRGAAYNQQYAPCSLLLEIGTSGNTLGEAEKSAAIVADALIKLIEELSNEH